MSGEGARFTSTFEANLGAILLSFCFISSVDFGRIFVAASRLRVGTFVLGAVVVADVAAAEVSAAVAVVVGVSFTLVMFVVVIGGGTIWSEEEFSAAVSGFGLFSFVSSVVFNCLLSIEVVEAAVAFTVAVVVLSFTGDSAGFDISWDG